MAAGTAKKGAAEAPKQNPNRHAREVAQELNVPVLEVPRKPPVRVPFYVPPGALPDDRKAADDEKAPAARWLAPSRSVPEQPAGSTLGWRELNEIMYRARGNGRACVLLYGYNHDQRRVEYQLLVEESESYIRNRFSKYFTDLDGEFMYYKVPVGTKIALEAGTPVPPHWDLITANPIHFSPPSEDNRENDPRSSTFFLKQHGGDLTSWKPSLTDGGNKPKRAPAADKPKKEFVPINLAEVDDPIAVTRRRRTRLI